MEYQEKEIITYLCNLCGWQETVAETNGFQDKRCQECGDLMIDKYAKDALDMMEASRSTNICEGCQTYPCICVRTETEVFGSGALRDKEDVPDYSLIPRKPLYRLAKRYSHGLVKYGARNWEQGDLPFAKDCLNRAAEHYLKYTSGDTSEDHLAAVLWNIVAVMHFEDRIGFIP